MLGFARRGSLKGKSATIRARFWTLCAVMTLVALLSAHSAQSVLAQRRADAGQGDEAARRPKKYEYYYDGELIELHPSSRFVAVEEGVAAFSDWIRTNRLRRDPLSDRHALRSVGLGLYRRTRFRGRGDRPLDLPEQVHALAEKAVGNIQPVFEQGPALLIPSGEVIVGFNETTTLAEARGYLTPYTSSLGIIDVRQHRKNAFIITLRTSSNGRAYDVSQSLAQLDRIAFAEPNHIVIRLDPITDTYRIGPLVAEEPIAVDQAGDSAFGGRVASGSDTMDGSAPIIRHNSPSWTTIASIDGESSAFPPLGWLVDHLTGSVDAYWGRTDYRSHGGSYSIYCAQSGSSGVPAPGPAPKRMQAVLRSPDYNLTGYEEVYVELWFYAKNDLWPDPGGTLYDYPSVYVFDRDAGYGIGQYLATYASGDCTTDPTTDNGWRKCVFRVPESYRVANAFFDFRYNSDNVDQYEGAYLDDILILGTTEVDTDPVGNDTFGARHWDLMNVGQIAGLGNDDNDLHATPSEAWGLYGVSENVVVAVVDEGVDLTHPDLNLVTGYDYDGSVGGGARGDHGTACAGEAGAIRDNATGVIGVAPNCKIMPVYWGTTYADLASAIDVAVAQGANILSNSWGWTGAPSTDVTDAINDALAAGRVMVFAAGNGPDRSPWTYDVVYPGSLTGSTDVICVGASSPTDQHKNVSSSDGQYYWGSSYVGDGPDICVPGCWSYTTDRQGAAGYNDGSTDLGDADYTHDFGGTSSSTPKVAAIAALLLSANPNLTPGQVKAIVRNTADDIGAAGVDDVTGAGRANAYRAVRSLCTVDAHSSPQADRDLQAWNDTEPEKMSVLKFRITDHGEDALDALVDRLVVSVGGTAGEAANDIAWAELQRDGVGQVATASSITNAEIVFGAAPNSDSVAQLDTVGEASYAEYTVNIYFNSSLLGEHGETYVFDIDETGVGVDLGGDSSLMAGDTSAATPVVGTIFISEIGITVTPGAWAIGSQLLGYVGESGTFTVENTGGVAEDIAIFGSNGSNGWTLASEAAVNAFKVEVDKDDDGSYETVLSTSEQPFATNVVVSDTETLGLRYSAPNGDSYGGGLAQDFTVTVKASEYVP
jgi:hypothetical protein